MDQRMDFGMDERMDGRNGRWTKEGMDERSTDERSTDERSDVCMDGGMDGRKKGRKDGRKEGWINESLDGSIDECTGACVVGRKGGREDDSTAMQADRRMEEWIVGKAKSRKDGEFHGRNVGMSESRTDRIIDALNGTRTDC